MYPFLFLIQFLQLIVTDGYAFAEVKVKHKSLMSRKLIGSCRIPLVEIAGAGPGGLRKWFKLLSADYELSPEPRGEVSYRLASMIAAGRTALQTPRPSHGFHGPWI